MDEGGVLWVGQEALDGWPEVWDRLGRIVEVDSEAVCLIAIVHVAKDVIVDVAEEMNIGFHAPIVLHVRQSWMMWEESGIPATHSMI